ncbi:MAG TPA: hypothetical protein VHN39_08590 [Phenylobacterium sp.]|jgi:hypothetical protein|nr:hypothetical protein [Phenylobacterium sp.]
MMKTVLMGLLATLLLSSSLLVASGAHAAPICVDRHGEMTRCGTPGAMPVGWNLPPDQQRDRLAARSDELSVRQWIGLTVFLAGLFALIALMPDFEGRWDGQETDEDEERG